MKAVRCGGLEASSLGNDFTLPRPRRQRFLGKKPKEPFLGCSNCAIRQHIKRQNTRWRGVPAGTALRAFCLLALSWALPTPTSAVTPPAPHIRRVHVTQRKEAYICAPCNETSLKSLERGRVRACAVLMSHEREPPGSVRT
eukprot:364839-Chlamydomonas_euryale.AAC.5